ncbi:hypothetical protein BOTBODRAFT_177543 [Botryobasidium botryosum FD-172 SS1]|uniref:F-box domain-containing protein n=1 Tax=Botryobasidium botryosum (strain FD-172 SS1) TaxID=930990 RepID=A0A067MGP1_BOTB1|nr:hypothetical protein BOTBODRAFT_177543 [Botryobasidium botryosum FD-172 SS1]
MVLVFRFAASGPNGRSLDHHMILTFCGVSHEWCDITRRTPELWANILPLPASLINVFLTRSGNAPLYVEYKRVGRRRKTSLSDFLSLLNLEVLYLKVRYFRATDESEDLRGIFTGGTPKLRELTLDSLYVPMDHPIMRT